MSSESAFARGLLAAVGIYSGLEGERPTPAVLANAIARVLKTPGGEAALTTALDVALRVTRPTEVSVAVTGLGWLGAGIPALEQALQVTIEEASEELQITSFSVTSGAARVVASLAAALERGVRITVVVNRFRTQDEAGQALLMRLSKRFAHSFHLHDFIHDNEMESLHAKLLVADRRVALVGSANLSFLGMIANHELGVLVRGPAAATISSCVDRLLCSPHVRAVPPVPC
jgi:phosphatidylserine/phosphatidylglycerophosphate/cardiolipin synthase-like enzyme